MESKPHITLDSIREIRYMKMHMVLVLHCIDVIHKPMMSESVQSLDEVQMIYPSVLVSCDPEAEEDEFETIRVIYEKFVIYYIVRTYLLRN